MTKQEQISPSTFNISNNQLHPMHHQRSSSRPNSSSSVRSPIQVQRMQAGDEGGGRQSTSPNTMYSDHSACSLVKQEMMHNTVNATVVSAIYLLILILIYIPLNLFKLILKANDGI